jgi:hypothetical protein
MTASITTENMNPRINRKTLANSANKFLNMWLMIRLLATDT